MAKKIKKQEKTAKAADVQPYMVSESSFIELIIILESGYNSKIFLIASSPFIFGITISNK